MANGHGGARKNAGRKKGKPNKVNARTREDIWAYCDEIGSNPFIILADMCKDEDKLIAKDAAKALAPYLLAALQRTEHDVSGRLKKVLEHRYARADH